MQRAESDALTRAGIGIMVLLFVVLAVRHLSPSTTFAADGRDRDWDAAVQMSHETGKPGVVLFTANWCPTCREMHSTVLSRTEISDELYDHFTFITIDLTNPTPMAQARAAKFGVSAIPTVIRYDRSGKESSRANFLDADEMLAWLRAGE